MPKCMKCMEDYEDYKYCPFCGTPAGSSAFDRGQLPAETILNRRYIVGEPVRQDRIGFVYLAWDALLERKVYIREWFPKKLVSREKGTPDVVPSMEEGLWEPLVQQFLMHALLLHRHQDIDALLSVYSSLQENNTAYWIMEYVEGQTLREVLSRKNPLDPGEAGAIIKRLTKAAEILHQNGFVHGNITPDNILFCSDGTIKLLDPAWFGGAMEKLRHVVFWSRYVPPKYRSVPLNVDEETDAYSTAAVYYRMLSGEEPFGVRSDQEEEELPSIEDYGIEVPVQTEKEIMRTLRGQEKKERGLLKFFGGK